MFKRTSLSPVDDVLRGDRPSLREVLKRFHLLGMARLVHRSVGVPARVVTHFLVKMLLRTSRLPVVGSLASSALDRIEPRLRHDMGLDELLRVCSALDTFGLTYWVAGGWGLDILVGCQTRRHDDLDIVLEDFWDNLASLDQVMRSLDYHRRPPLGGVVWFPDAAVYEDSHGHHLEVVNINWGVLEASRDLLTSSPNSSNGEPVGLASVVSACTTRAVVDGATLPVLSIGAQHLFHLGFGASETHGHDAEILKFLGGETVRWWAEPHSLSSMTLLLIPIFSIPVDVWNLCRRAGNDLDKVPPHLTVAFPFLPASRITEDVIETLATIVAEVSSSVVQFSQVKWFGSDVVYLEPDPGDLCASLTIKLCEVFPEFHPYDDQFETIVPHLTLSEHETRADRRLLARRVQKHLPFSARATHVWLMCNSGDDGAWIVKDVFPLSR